jgi:hypothetical protein
MLLSTEIAATPGTTRDHMLGGPLLLIIQCLPWIRGTFATSCLLNFGLHEPVAFFVLSADLVHLFHSSAVQEDLVKLATNVPYMLGGLNQGTGLTSRFHW